MQGRPPRQQRAAPAVRSESRRLLLAALIQMSFRSTFRMLIGVRSMRPRRVGVLRGLLVAAGVMMLGRLGMVFRRLSVMVGGLLVMIYSCADARTALARRNWMTRIDSRL